MQADSADSRPGADPTGTRAVFDPQTYGVLKQEVAQREQRRRAKPPERGARFTPLTLQANAQANDRACTPFRELRSLHCSLYALVQQLVLSNFIYHSWKKAQVLAHIRSAAESAYGPDAKGFFPGSWEIAEARGQARGARWVARLLGRWHSSVIYASVVAAVVFAMTTVVAGGLQSAPADEPVTVRSILGGAAGDAPLLVNSLPFLLFAVTLFLGYVHKKAETISTEAEAEAERPT